MKKTYKRFTALLLTGIAVLAIAALGMTALAHGRSQPTDPYYLQAEVVSSQNGETTFGQVDGEQPTQYLYSISGTYTDDVPYLLSMDPMGTSTCSDDEILVVWLPAVAAAASST